MAKNPDLRTRIEHALAGTLPPHRGNVISEADRKAASDIATACSKLCSHSERGGEPITAPTELILPLP